MNHPARTAATRGTVARGQIDQIELARLMAEGPARALGKYEAIVAGLSDVDRKGAKNPYTSVNGHMFSFLDPEGTLAIRLSSELRDEFESEYGPSPIEQYGVVMKEYVAVPPALFEDAAAATGWLRRSYLWAKSLKPKATRREK